MICIVIYLKIKLISKKFPQKNWVFNIMWILENITKASKIVYLIKY